MRPILLLAITLLVTLAGRAHAQGGPPFITDDPGTPGNGHWEINLGWLASHNPANANYQTPDFDFNYGLGERVQLKYEVPIAINTNADNTTRAGLGESLLGVKIRAYEHHKSGEKPSDENMDLSIGSYPQVAINNPTSAVRRGVVENGPEYYLPLQMTKKLGPINLNGEIGRWFGNRHVPDRWGRGLIAGHEFNDRFELYGELYDLQDANRIDGAPKQRSLTADIGGRLSLRHDNKIRLLFMGGRAIQAVRRDNSEPNWIAYLGFQFQLGPKEKEVPGKTP